ncbi:MAG: ATP phosphoribosyltransferase regulatory subunit [Candidatus Shikimatogenerans bostrichidophilus]|nr:MAG: ATP phosphoribosyltransferase regulatory subunit [Candidatus Shikimatogenerans bostrichidophilus]
MKKIRNLKGTLDLYDNKLIIIKYIIKKIKNILINNGYTEIKTPFLENIKLIKNLEQKKIYKIKNKFLIYDLTLPLKRFIKNRKKIILPFKRYQIQKVWRGEKPQYNRYREFYQFDADIITFKKKNNKLLILEIINICYYVFKKLNLKVILLINHKYILKGICNILHIKSKKKKKYFFRIIDKIKKRGINYVINKLINKKIIKKKEDIIKIKKKKNKYINKGINYLKYIINFFKKKIDIKIDFFLYRDINIYNGFIFEIINKKNINFSLSGGGEYKLDKKKGIGISFGIYRIYNLLKKKKIKEKHKKKKILLINFGINYYKLYLNYNNKLINNKIISEIYPYPIQIRKQIKYAIKKKIRLLLIIGSKELLNKKIKIKDLIKRKEYKINKNKIIDSINKIYKL